MQSYGAMNRSTWIRKFRDLEGKNTSRIRVYCSPARSTVHPRRNPRSPVRIPTPAKRRRRSGTGEAGVGERRDKTAAAAVGRGPGADWRRRVMLRWGGAVAGEGAAASVGSMRWHGVAERREEGGAATSGAGRRVARGGGVGGRDLGARACGGGDVDLRARANEGAPRVNGRRGGQSPSVGLVSGAREVADLGFRGEEEEENGGVYI